MRLIIFSETGSNTGKKAKKKKKKAKKVEVASSDSEEVNYILFEMPYKIAFVIISILIDYLI